MPKTINQYEWENRLGSVTHQLKLQGKNLRGYKQQFADKIEAPEHELLDKLANSCEQLGTMVREVEDEIHRR